MKCSQHNQTDTDTTCFFCGRPHCLICMTQTKGGWVVCSVRCSEGIGDTEKTLESIRQKTITSNRYFLLGTGVLMADLALFKTRPFVAFLSTTALAFIVAGIALFKTTVRARFASWRFRRGNRLQERATRPRHGLEFSE